MYLKENLKLLRKRRKRSQEDVAKRSGVSSSAMRKWRSGKRSPMLMEIEAVINVLGGKLIAKIVDTE